MSSLRPTERFDSRQVTPRPTPRALEMSHGALDAYRDAYARVRVEREAWAREHARARALFGAVVNAFERLPALARAMTRKTYGDDVEATFARATVSAQYASLDAMFVGLVEACEGLERVATAMRRAKTDAWRRIDAMEHAPSLGGGEKVGPQPSVAECVLGLEEMWRMHRDESALARALTTRARTCEDAEELRTMHRLFAAQANLDPEEIRLIIDRVPVKNVESDRGRR